MRQAGAVVVDSGAGTVSGSRDGGMAPSAAEGFDAGVEDGDGTALTLLFSGAPGIDPL